MLPRWMSISFLLTLIAFYYFNIAQYLGWHSTWSRVIVAFIVASIVWGIAYAILEGLGIVPGPQTSLISIQSASFHANKFLGEYLAGCRGIDQGAILDTLIEDYPLKLSPESERTFLQNNSDWKTAEALFKEAIEKEEQVSGERQTYNIANALNKLGFHYRTIRDWENSIKCIEESLVTLGELHTKYPNKVNVLTEMATAYFHLGQVYLARYRETKDPNDRRMAETNLKKSIEMDKGLGQDYSATTRLLQKLDKN